MRQATPFDPTIFQAQMSTRALPTNLSFDPHLSQIWVSNEVRKANTQLLQDFSFLFRSLTYSWFDGISI